MKTLKNHLILYDAACPMCKLYTGIFTGTGMLEREGAKPYQQMPAIACPYVDRSRAVNEIALVNLETGNVSYGMDSLLKVIGNSWPILSPLFRFRPFLWLMKKAYGFVSYNRRVIVPLGAQDDPLDMQPAFSLPYRLLYLVFTWLLTGLILTHYAGLLKELVPLGGTYREYWICGGQVIFQGLITGLTVKDKMWHYLGNMMTISFAGALLLLPALILSKFLTLPVIFYLLYFLGIAGLMLLEHIRRTYILKIGLILTISWVTYRLIVLLLIFLM